MVIKGWLLCAKASPGRRRQTALNRAGADNLQFCCGAATDGPVATRAGGGRSDASHCVAIVYIAVYARLVRAGGIKHLNFGNYSAPFSSFPFWGKAGMGASGGRTPAVCICIARAWLENTDCGIGCRQIRSRGGPHPILPPKAGRSRAVASTGLIRQVE